MNPLEILSIFGATFGLIFLSELADKTQLIIFSIGIKYKKPLEIFSGAILAHAIVDGIAILAGNAIGGIFKAPLLKFGIAGLFIAMGAYFLIKKEKDKNVPPLIKSAFLAAFSLIFLSEFGDKSQIVAGLLSARYELPVVVFAATILALSAAIGLNLLLGKKITNFVGHEKAEKASAALFIIYGIIFLVI